FGLGLLVRQSAALFVAGGIVYLLVAELAVAADPEVPERPRRGRGQAVVLFAAGAVLPLALTCLGLLAAGTFRTFWFWVVAYAPHYQADLSSGWRNLVRTLGAAAPSTSVALTLAAVGVAAVLRDRRRERRAFVLALTASAVLGTIMGLQFRPHYFLLALPALALLAGLGLAAL